MCRQSVTSTLSEIQRFLNCQTKRTLIGGFALLLSVIAQGRGVQVLNHRMCWQSVTSTLSEIQRFLNCQTKRTLIGGFALLLSVIAQGMNVRLAGMVSKAVVKMCRCFNTYWMTRFNNYASERSLHATLAVNKTRNRSSGTS